MTYEVIKLAFGRTDENGQEQDKNWMRKKTNLRRCPHMGKPESLITQKGGKKGNKEVEEV